MADDTSGEQPPETTPDKPKHPEPKPLGLGSVISSWSGRVVWAAIVAGASALALGAIRRLSRGGRARR
jgi:hypothetical protein